jgi:hypothetical protein
VIVWERERVERDPTYVASSKGSRFFGTEPRETNRQCLCVNLALWFDSFSPLSLSSLACNHFELAPKVIRIDWATRGKKNYLPHSDSITTHSNTNLEWSLCPKFIIYMFRLFTPSRLFSIPSIAVNPSIPRGSHLFPFIYVGRGTWESTFDLDATSMVVRRNKDVHLLPDHGDCCDSGDWV